MRVKKSYNANNPFSFDKFRLRSLVEQWYATRTERRFSANKQEKR